MIVVTTETIQGRDISETLGLVRGNTIRARHVGRDIIAQLKTLVGGEIHEYAKLMGEAREQAIDRMVSCLLYTSPSPRDLSTSRMPSSA